MADTDNEYEMLRQRRIEANHAKLASLNLLSVKVDIVPCKVVKSLPVTQPAASRSLPLTRLMTDDIRMYLHEKLDMLGPKVKQKIPAVLAQLEKNDVFTTAGLLALSAQTWDRLIDQNEALTTGIWDALLHEEPPPAGVS